MKKTNLILICFLLIFVSSYSQLEQKTTKVGEKNTDKSVKRTDKQTKKLRKKHAQYLKKSPFKNSLQLSSSQRKSLALPPNKYFESEWELTMNPLTGKPDFQNLKSLQQKLIAQNKKNNSANRAPGDSPANKWIERGPNNVGGRTRAIMYDPNDTTNETVFAGGVSGGLWKNTNISNSDSKWTRVDIPENLTVSALTFDPNNKNVFYLGTGESYTGGDFTGDGIWKSSDKGATWTKVFGGVSGPSTFEASSFLTVNSPAGIQGNYTTATTTAFGTVITTPLTNEVVLVTDASTTNPTEGCGPLTNGASLAGKIALIKRGSCNFAVKVKNAENAGAIAAIIINNIDGIPAALGGADPSITIPSVAISKSDGAILQNALTTGTVNVTLSVPTPGGFTGILVPGAQHINALKVRNNSGVTEIYAAVSDSRYGSSNETTYLGAKSFGLYKSIDNGQSWKELTLPLIDSNKHCPNDIEFGADNTIWVSTTNSSTFGNGGGKVFSSTDGGNTFIEKFKVINGERTQIEVSPTNANNIYILAEIPTGVAMIKTTDNFTTTVTMGLPDDADTGIPPADFTRGQAFYDLLLKIDPTNDQILYAGGIDLFRTTNGGTSWEQISKWSNNNNLARLTCSEVHADQHEMVFKPGNTNQALFGTDGGVFYATSLSTAVTSDVISSRNNGFNVTQFYSLGVGPTNEVSGIPGDAFVAGAQDNGTQYFGETTSGTGVSASTEVQGGDGAFSMFDQGADQYFITNYVYNNDINYRTTTGGERIINRENTSNGAFIAPMVLDSNLDILYSDYTAAAVPATATTPAVPVSYQIRRYTNLKAGTVGKVILKNALLTNAPTAFAVSKYTTTTTMLLVGTRNGKLLKVANADTATPTWTDITGPKFIGSVSDVEYGQSENEIFVTFHNYNVTNVWYTSDGGVTWQNKEGNFPDIPVKCILQNPLNVNEVIIGTELGVWYSNNFNAAAPEWKQSFNGMSNVKVTDLDLRNDNTVYAATYGRGVFSGKFTNAILSIEEQDNLSGFKIYPSPSKGIVNIKADKFAGKLDINVFDLNGRIVYSQIENDFNLEKSLNLNNLQSGVYIVKVSGNQQNYTQRIILE
jgi:hypothetical protein